jgi:hypothetical protein
LILIWIPTRAGPAAFKEVSASESNRAENQAATFDFAGDRDNGKGHNRQILTATRMHAGDPAKVIYVSRWGFDI